MPIPDPPSSETAEQEGADINPAKEEVEKYILERGCDDVTILKNGCHLVQIEIDGTFISAKNTTDMDVEVLFEFSNGKYVKVNLGPLASVTGVAFLSGTQEDCLVNVSRIVSCGKCLYCRLNKEEELK